jgi:class 3 adenylate cyclase/predicted ATPase
MASNPRSANQGRVSEAERRQLTVMFCDLVDSTALAERLDPEEYRDLVEIYQRACEEVIDRFEGRIAQYLGDGLLVYFGFPVAHEDDARRAVLSGLGILEALEQLNQRLEPERGVKLAARLGIHTGLAVVGEIGGHGRQDQLAVGETPNVAARLQGLAAPHTLLVSAATHRLVYDFFTVQDLGEHAIRGLSVAMRLYRVLGESGAQSRLEGARLGGLTELVGRRPELDVLLDRWAQARHGGQAVLLSGEAGIGKSRLVEALRDHVVGEPHVRLECRCSPYYQHTALYPVIDLLQRRMAWRRDDSPVELLRKLEALLGPYEVPLPEAVPLFAALLALPLPDDRYPPLRLTPQRQRARTLEVVLKVLRSIASRQPALLIMEDLHWVDPTTAELLRLLLQDPPSSLLSVLVFRPEFRPPWPTGPDQTTVALAPLTRDETADMITRVAGDKRLPSEVLKQLVANTDGNPLFVEELTKVVLESGLLLEAGDRYEIAWASGALAIPTTLHDSLIARLDRLGSAKPVAQLAAVLGRTFPRELLQAVSAVDSVTLDAALARLSEAGLLYEQSPPPQARYLFKHALIQEVAYQSLLRTTRQRHHRRVAEALADKFPEIADTQPELLAHHYTEASLGAQAIPYWLRAGQRAVERSANVEAISHLTRGLGLLREIPEDVARDQREIALLTTLGPPLMAVRGQSAEEVERVLGRAQELCTRLDDHDQLFKALRGLWRCHQARGDTGRSYELAGDLLRLAERVHDTALFLEAYYARGTALFWRGDLVAAQEHFERVMALYDPGAHRSHAFVYGSDPDVISRGYAAWTLWYRGFPAHAEQYLDTALSRAEELAHPYSLAFVLHFVSGFHYFRREPEPTRAWAERTITFSDEHGFPMWSAVGVMLRGWALTAQDRAEEGIAQLRQGLRAWEALGNGVARPHFLTMLARGLAHAGRIDESLATVEEARAIVQRYADRTHEAVDVYLCRGDLLFGMGRYGDAEACFGRALEVARGQDMKIGELRATIGLSRLWARAGNRTDAYERLIAIYRWFPEGLESSDFREARACLEELQPTADG